MVPMYPLQLHITMSTQKDTWTGKASILRMCKLAVLSTCSSLMLLLVLLALQIRMLSSTSLMWVLSKGFLASYVKVIDWKSCHLVLLCLAMPFTPAKHTWCLRSKALPLVGLYFNWQSASRVMIERSFGVLKGRFACLAAKLRFRLRFTKVREGY